MAAVVGDRNPSPAGRKFGYWQTWITRQMQKHQQAVWASEEKGHAQSTAQIDMFSLPPVDAEVLPILTACMSDPDDPLGCASLELSGHLRQDILLHALGTARCIWNLALPSGRLVHEVLLQTRNVETATAAVLYLALRTLWDHQGKGADPTFHRERIIAVMGVRRKLLSRAIIECWELTAQCGAETYADLVNIGFVPDMNRHGLSDDNS